MHNSLFINNMYVLGTLSGHISVTETDPMGESGSSERRCEVASRRCASVERFRHNSGDEERNLNTCKEDG